MSTTYLAVAAFVVFANTVTLILVGREISKRNKLIADLRNGQEQWRGIAQRSHKKLQASEQNVVTMTGRALVAARHAELQGEKFKAVVTALWGYPPLDRKAEDVIGAIKTLRGRIADLEIDKKAMSAACTVSGATPGKGVAKPSI